MQAQPAAERRRLRHREEARRTILDAAERLLVEDGYERFSMRRLADRCGYTAPTLYYYFPDKSGLLDVLLEERFGRLLDQLRRVAPGSDPVVHLRGLIVALVRFGLSHPSHYTLLSLPRDPSRPQPPSAEKVMDMLVASFEDLQRAGLISEADRESAGQVMRALIHGLISIVNGQPSIGWLPDLPERAIDALLRGLVRGRASSEGARA
jgi:AcrR family transcriptional regulator